MVYEMKSVMIFNPNDSQSETERKWLEWNQNNKSAVADKAVPNAKQTQEYLKKQGNIKRTTAI